MLNNKNPPYLAVITETNACDSDHRVDETFQCIQNALGETNENGIDLISIRVVPPVTATVTVIPKNMDANDNDSNSNSNQNSADKKEEEQQQQQEQKDFQNRVITLAKRIMELKEKIPSKNSYIVVINDNVDAAIESNVDGVHVKESKVTDISKIRKLLDENKKRRMARKDNIGKDDDGEEFQPQPQSQPQIIIGTSAHSIDTALSSWKAYSPDYFFVGTCYLTQSHPEKDATKLEGPTLPGKVRQALYDEYTNEKKKLSNGTSSVDCNGNGNGNGKPLPIILAIGGIDDENCNEPVVKFGADGVAVIRSVMQASEPRNVVIEVKNKMQQ